MLRGFKKWCEDQANLHRQQLSLNCHDPLLAEDLAAHLEIAVINPEDVPEMSSESLRQLVTVDPRSWSAVTLKANGSTVIIHNPTHSRVRQQSNLLHEMSHGILGHKPIRFISIPGVPFPVREFREQDEDEAKWLAGCLQIPRIGLEWALRRRMTSQQIASHFIASNDMVKYRRNVTGIDIQRKRARWYRR